MRFSFDLIVINECGVVFLICLDGFCRSLVWFYGQLACSMAVTLTKGFLQ